LWGALLRSTSPVMLLFESYEYVQTALDDRQEQGGFRHIAFRRRLDDRCPGEVVVRLGVVANDFRPV